MLTQLTGNDAKLHNIFNRECFTRKKVTGRVWGWVGIPPPAPVTLGGGRVAGTCAGCVRACAGEYYMIIMCLCMALILPTIRVTSL